MGVRVVKWVERQFIPLPEWGFFDEKAFFLSKCYNSRSLAEAVGHLAEVIG